jgi:hypothetical protein
MYEEKLLTERDKAEIEAERAAVIAAQVAAQTAIQTATHATSPSAQEARRAEPKSEGPRVADDRTKRSDKTVDKEPGLIDRFFFNGSSR